MRGGPRQSRVRGQLRQMVEPQPCPELRWQPVPSPSRVPLAGLIESEQDREGYEADERGWEGDGVLAMGEGDLDGLDFGFEAALKGPVCIKAASLFDDAGKSWGTMIWQRGPIDNIWASHDGIIPDIAPQVKVAIVLSGYLKRGYVAPCLRLRFSRIPCHWDGFIVRIMALSANRQWRTERGVKSRTDAERVPPLPQMPTMALSSTLIIRQSPNPLWPFCRASLMGDPFLPPPPPLTAELNCGSSLLRVGSVATSTFRGIGFIALGPRGKVVG